MDLSYERTEHFDGDAAKAIEIARNTFLPNGFEILESDETHLEAVKDSLDLFFKNRILNPIEVISKICISANDKEITLRAELGGIKKLILYYVKFMILMLSVFLVVFGVLLFVNNEHSILLIAFICIITITPFALVTPAAAIWFKAKAIETLDILMNNMLSVSRLQGAERYVKRKMTAQILLLVFAVIGIIAIDVPLSVWFARKVNPEISLYTAIDGQAVEFISEQYKNIITQADQKNIYATCHIFYVNNRFVSCYGGIGYFRNRTGKQITDPIRISGTNHLNQTFYDTSMRKLDVEFIRDQRRSDLYHIYFTPEEPIEPGETFYYLRSMDKSRQLGPDLNPRAKLTMQNRPGSHVIGTFFLVLPKKLGISQNNPPTSSRQLDNFSVYWWTKEVMPDEDHTEKIVITK